MHKYEKGRLDSKGGQSKVSMGDLCDMSVLIPRLLALKH